MREFIKAMNSYSLAMGLFGVKEVENLLTPSERGDDRGPATHAMETVTNATREQFGDTLDSTFRAIDGFQRFATDVMFYSMFPFAIFFRGREANGRRQNGTLDGHRSEDGIRSFQDRQPRQRSAKNKAHQSARADEQGDEAAAAWGSQDLALSGRKA